MLGIGSTQQSGGGSESLLGLPQPARDHASSTARSESPSLQSTQRLTHEEVHAIYSGRSSSSAGVELISATAEAADAAQDLDSSAEPEPEPEPGPTTTTRLGADVGKAAGEGTKHECKHAQKPELVREVTRYTTRKGLRVAVEGFRWVSDERGGNLAAHGKHTGEAFWHVSRMLSDYLCWDCPALQPEAATGTRRRVIDLGCGLGLAGLVAATLLDETGRVDLTDGDVDVVHRAQLSAAANSKATQPATVAASVLWWGDESTIAALNQTANTGSELAASTTTTGSDGERTTGSARDGSEKRAFGGYDLVLASDCIYENGSDPSIAVAMAKSLAKTAAALLKPEPMEYALLPLRGETPPEECHAWIDMAEHVGDPDADEYTWPPRPCRQARATDAECEAGASANEGDTVRRSVVGVRPMCAVGFGRRNVPLSVILDAFEAEGFEHHLPHAGHQDDPDAPEGCVGCCVPLQITMCPFHSALKPLFSCVLATWLVWHCVQRQVCRRYFSESNRRTHRILGIRCAVLHESEAERVVEG